MNNKKLSNICMALLLCFSFPLIARNRDNSAGKKYTIMLAPAGDARQTGRVIGNSFERWIAFECARAIKERVEQQLPRIQIVLSRTPGEILEPLQVANFCNRITANLCISLHFYQEEGIKPTCTLYRYATGNDFLGTPSSLSFCPIYRAHQYHQSESTALAKQLKEHLARSEHANQFILEGVHTVPFAPLRGILAPALGIEMSLKQVGDWQQYVAPLAESIQRIAEGAL